MRSPLTGVLAAGAVVSLWVGAAADVAIIAAAIGANVAVGTWQERQAGRAAEALERLGSVQAKVLRDGEPVCVSAEALVSGDVVLLASGDRVVADARLIEDEALEVDEAALTGESLPVAKAVDAPSESDRVVLEGSDVTVGSGKAVVVAVGAGTRLGATAAALALDETRESPLGRRLGHLFHQGLPVLFTGGALVTASGLLWGKPLVEQLALGASIAVAAVPEGLPLLAGVAQAGVARRLAGHRALVRRLAAVEALGRVDVAACDKTGTLTEGRLAVSLVVGVDGDEAGFPGELSDDLANVLRIAGLASPMPDAATAHPTDVAVVEAAARRAPTSWTASAPARRRSSRRERSTSRRRGGVCA
jgi:cation-transporting ATPase I